MTEVSEDGGALSLARLAMAVVLFRTGAVDGVEIFQGREELVEEEDVGEAEYGRGRVHKPASRLGSIGF